MVVYLLRAYSFCLLLFLGSTCFAEVTLKLNRSTVAINESVVLTLTASESAQIPRKILNNLQQHFDVSNQGQTTQTNCHNFDCTTEHIKRYLLKPKSTGDFNIPSMIINGEKTQAMTIQVTDINLDPNQGNLPPVFLELISDKQSAYIQEQIILTLKFNSLINLTELQLVPYNPDNDILKQINSTQYERKINGQSYQTYEITFALFAQQSGPLSIGPMEIQGYQFDSQYGGGFRSLFDQGRKVSYRSNALQLQIEPAIPSNNEWLPAASLTLQEKWLSNINEIKVGDSLTREITIAAKGLSAEQLPNIELKDSNQFRVYAEPAQRDNKQNELGIMGIATEKMAIVPTQPGQLTLPAISIVWWNTTTQAFATATLPEQTLTILPSQELPVTPTQKEATATTQQPTSSASAIASSQPLLWQIALAISLLLNVIALFLLLKRRKSQPLEKKQATTTASPLAALLTACDTQSAKTIKSALVNFAQDESKDRTLFSLTDLKRYWQNEFMQNLLTELESALQQNSSITINKTELKAALHQQHQSNELDSLYPTH